jgi:hypothetical protein
MSHMSPKNVKFTYFIIGLLKPSHLASWKGGPLGYRQLPRYLKFPVSPSHHSCLETTQNC